MNIQEAKEEIIRTIKVYTARDEDGMFRIPSIQQRPLLLMGPPGIGKTAIVEQAAAECGTGMLSYAHDSSYPPECHRTSGTGDASV